MGPPHHNVYGFTEGKSAADSMASLLSTINNQPAVVVFLDLEKAFELISPTAIADALAAKGVSGRLSWAHDYLRDRSAKVRFQGHVSSEQGFENGTPQGGVLSPTLFNALMEALAKLPLGRIVTLLSYADDLALVAVGRGNRLSWAQKALDSVTAACRDLGLSVSAGKSRAMSVLGPTPEQSLRIQGVRLEWCTAYQYLGVWIDHRLTFSKEAEYLKNSVVTSLERCQNDALRHILGAPRWTKLEALRAEAELPPLMLRIEQVAAAWAAKTVVRLSDTPARRRLLTSLAQDARLFTGRTWARGLARATRLSLPDVDLAGRGPDEKAEGYVDPPPWAADVARFHMEPLPFSKQQGSRETLLAHARGTLARTSSDGASVYYTDGSVDRERGRTAAAFVSGEETHGWRTGDHCSTLQAELVALLTALQHALRTDNKDINVYTDSMTALQTLRRDRVRDNIRLVTMTLDTLGRLRRDERAVTFAWIPSHAGVPGNEAADAAAKQALDQDRIAIEVPVSLQQLKRTAKRTTGRRALALVKDAEATSASLHWYANATGYETVPLPSSLARRDRVMIHRLRLGYPTVRSLIADYEGELSLHCLEDTDGPLVHYLLDCAQTGPLRTMAARRGYTPCGARRTAAARMVRYLTDDLGTLTRFLRQREPPRIPSVPLASLRLSGLDPI
ncbi:uncharacterized protein LOC126992035 [Eriocheir sinensis]|uniref:uncharacterized protein LOC126992035 n=1 Tax=Eriocheir sinensis TaxID=95602 RepID=UPI0021C88516|nr:uncharacterized protein LOC126992035 [Eriocheir sinensis]